MWPLFAALVKNLWHCACYNVESSVTTASETNQHETLHRRRRKELTCHRLTTHYDHIEWLTLISIGVINWISSTVLLVIRKSRSLSSIHNSRLGNLVSTWGVCSKHLIYTFLRVIWSNWPVLSSFIVVHLTVILLSLSHSLSFTFAW